VLRTLRVHTVTSTTVTCTGSGLEQGAQLADRGVLDDGAILRGRLEQRGGVLEPILARAAVTLFSFEAGFGAGGV
jgi:hypothetical protein